MMCWPSGVTATAKTEPVCPLKVWTSVPPTWYSRTARLALVVAVARPTTKCTPSGSAAADARQLPIKGALERAVERPQLRGVVGRAADEARAAGSNATVLTQLVASLQSWKG